jgi:hypothetical protein
MVIKYGEKRSSEFGFFSLCPMRYASFEKEVIPKDSSLVEKAAHTYFCQIFLPGNTGHFCHCDYHQH